MPNIYFDFPVQVLFFDGNDEENNSHYCAGIGYKDEIICGCCGAILSIEEIEQDAKEEGVTSIYVFSEWVDITADIKGDTDLEEINMEYCTPIDRFLRKPAEEKYEQLQFDIKN